MFTRALGVYIVGLGFRITSLGFKGLGLWGLGFKGLALRPLGASKR